MPDPEGSGAPPPARESLDGPPRAQRIGGFEIESELGRGAMGVVYLARDSKLGRRVALKALIEAGLDDAQFLARFRREARVLAAINHPNVAAIHGLEEIDARPYLVLEYVPGETLADQIARGPLAVARALDIAAQIGAALEAAHQRGVVHRDLKPANVKVTPDGTVKVLDFGLAKRVREDDGSTHVQSIEVSQPGLIVGTIAYMSPEQLRGQAVDARSDVWALGCVLFECLSGTKAFAGASAPDTIAAILHREPDWDALPSHVPARVDGLLHRALSKDPRERPQSAAQFAAEISGSAALRAALAAGETPTPEMVAAAGADLAPPPRTAGLLLALALGLLATTAALSPHVFLEGREPPSLSPDELSARASAHARAFGYDGPIADSERLFGHDADFIGACAENGRSRERWGRSEAVYFWYRESPAPLCPTALDLSDDLGDVTPFNPPQNVPGMATAYLDTRGRLIEFEAVPQRVEPTRLALDDWKLVFDASGLERGGFEPAEPRWIAPVECDQRAAWHGCDPEAPEVELTLEAGAFDGRVVFVKLLAPWTRARDPARTMVAFTQSRSGLIGYSLALAVLAGAIWLARRNVVRGIADLRGARRLALFVLAARMLAWALEAEHVTVFVAQMHMLITAIGYATFYAALLWVTYLALEPAIRRRSPWRIIGWSRLLAGRWRDPLVGADLLRGVCVGAGLATLVFGVVRFGPSLGLEPIPWLCGYQSVLAGNLGSTLSQAVILAQEPIQNVVLWLGALVLASRLLRYEWLVIALLFVPLALSAQEFERTSLVYLPRWLVTAIALLWVTVALRWGMLAVIVGLYVYVLAIATPPLTASTPWTLPCAAILLAIPAALACWGAWLAFAARPRDATELAPARAA